MLLAAVALLAIVGLVMLVPTSRRVLRWWAPAFLRARARAAQYEKRVAESQQRLQDFAEASSDWLWEMGPDLRFTYMSERLRDVLGFDPAYTIGKRREDLSDMSLEPEHWARHLADLRSHRPFRDFTYKMRLPDERVRYISVSGKPIFDSYGRFLGYRGTGRDVTAAVMGELALKKQSELVLALIGNLPFGVTLFDAEWKCVAFNDRHLELLNLPRDRIQIGTPFETFIRINAERGEYGPGDVDELVRQRLAVDLSKPHRFEHRSVDGRIIEIRHTPLPDGGFLRTHLDITPYRLAEQRARDSEVRFRDFAESSTDWLWEQDADLRFTYLSHGALERFGLVSEDFIGRRREDTKPIGVTQEQWAAHCADIEAHRPFRDFRMARKDKEGRLRWCTISGWPIFDEHGRFAGYRGTGRDITSEVEAEQRAALAQAETARKSAMLETMLANMSEGIAIYDRDLKLVTFNRRWQEMLQLPDDLARIGIPFQDILYFLARRGDFGKESIDDAVATRVTQARNPGGHRAAKWYAGGRFIEARRTPLPDGGFISVMADLTELKAAEERFRDFAEATSDWFWEQDAELRFTYVTPSVYEKSGITAEQHIGLTRMETKPLGVSEEQWLAHRAAVEARQPFRDFRVQRIDPQGRRRILAISGKPVFGPDGRFMGYRGSGADITDRIEAEERAKLAQARFGGAIESLRDALAIFDADDRLVMCNQAYREVIGGSEEIVKPGATFEEILRYNLEHGFLRTMDDKEAFIRRRIEQHRNPGEPIQLQRSDGGWLQIREQRLADGGTAVIGTDITATKKHEQELFEKSEILERTLANMGEGIIVFDRELKLLAWNHRMVELLDLPPGLLRMGLTYEEFLRPQAERGEFGNEPVEQAIRDRIERARSMQPFAIDRRRPNGRYISLRRNPMPDGGFVALYSDVTERHRAENALRDAKEAAEIANRTKSEFLANMSHELRTPLNAIIGFSEIIEKEIFGPIGSPRYKEYANDIFESGTHLLNLINDILDVSKAEAGKIELQESQILLADLVDSSLRLIMPRAREAGVALAEPHVDHLPPLRADERRLKQVLINLLSNAVKFTPAGGRVSLDATVEPERGLAIRVRDTGIGMAPEEILKAMEPFGQVDSRLARKYEGTGLGLPLSKALVELHGGTLEIESQPGAGTTVTVRLPPERLVRDSVATVHRLRRQSR
jgi:PAS domain S-box-containing protein